MGMNEDMEIPKTWSTESKQWAKVNFGRIIRLDSLTTHQLRNALSTCPVPEVLFLNRRLAESESCSGNHSTFEWFDPTPFVISILLLASICLICYVCLSSCKLQRPRHLRKWLVQAWNLVKCDGKRPSRPFGHIFQRASSFREDRMMEPEDLL